MSSLPERQTTRAVEPFAVQQNVPEVYRPQPIQSVERQEVVWVPDAYGRMVPMAKELAPPRMVAESPRDLTPQPLIDPIAQRLGCGALLAVGVGFGGWLLFTPWAAICIGGAAVIVVAMRLPAGRRGNTTINVTNNNRWWGNSSTPVKK